MPSARYITAAYWFTASTSFANPAVTLARSLTDTFTGIRPNDIAAFVVAPRQSAPRARRCFPAGSFRLTEVAMARYKRALSLY